MVSDLSLVMDVPTNLSKCVNHMSFVISYFLNTLIIHAAQQRDVSCGVLFFPGLIGFTIPSMLGRVALLKF